MSTQTEEDASEAVQLQQDVMRRAGPVPPYDPPGPYTDHDKNVALRFITIYLFIIGLFFVL